MKNRNLQNLVLSALFLALAFVLPFFTGQIPAIGKMLLPMHVPVLLCGFVCGFPWGLLVGLIAPLLRSAILGMPVFFPTALCMAAELCAYGAFAALFHKILPKKRGFIYLSLVLSMLLGRLVWGGAMLLCTGIAAAMVFQTFINIGMCIGITPVIGITLPFFSYGGSSMVTMYAAMGIISGVKYKPKPERFSLIY